MLGIGIKTFNRIDFFVIYPGCSVDGGVESNEVASTTTYTSQKTAVYYPVILVSTKTQGRLGQQSNETREKGSLYFICLHL